MKTLPTTLAAFALCLSLACGASKADDSKMIDDLGRAAVADAGQKLLPYLDSGNAQERWRAARALGLLKVSAATGKLVELLADNDPIVRLHAVVALGRIGDKSPETIQAVMKQVASDDGRVARAAIVALRKLSPGPEKVAAAMESVLESDDQLAMTYAVEALVEAGGSATPLLEKMLGQEKSAYWAAVAIADIGPDAGATAPALAQAIARFEDPSTLQQLLLAVAALGRSGLPAAEAVTNIAHDTGEDGPRIAACYALGSIGAESATGLLRRLKSEGGDFQQIVCVWSISKLHPDDPAAQEEAIKLLTAALSSDRPEVRDAAATGLAKLDAPSEKIAPALLAALDGADDEQKSNIAAALASLGPAALDKAISALEKVEFRDIAIEVIGRLGPEAAEAAGPLAMLLKDAPDEQKARINFALASIGPAADKQAIKVADCLSSSAAEVRQSALFALRKIQPTDQSRVITLALTHFISSNDSDFERLAALWTAAAMNPDSSFVESIEKAFPAALENKDPQVRRETILAIGELGPVAAQFKGKLIYLAKNDSDSEVRAAAREVVEGM